MVGKVGQNKSVSLMPLTPIREIEMGTHVNLIDCDGRSLNEVVYGEVPNLTIYDLNSADSRVRDIFFQQLEDDIEAISSRHSNVFPVTVDELNASALPTEAVTLIEGLFQKAAGGDSSAMIQLAHDCLENQNFSDAKKWYKQALERGHPEASVGLGRLYLKLGDQESAKKLFLAESENPEALYELAKLYFESKEYQRAFCSTLRAAAYQNVEAINLLGILQVLGLGIEKNNPEARKNFLKAAKLGHKQAMNNYALMLYLGLGGDVDLLTANHLFNESAGSGVAAGYYHLGLMYEKGRGVDQHEKTAKDCFLGSSRLGSPIAMTRLGYWYQRNGRMDKAIHWWTQGAEEDDAEAIVALWNHLKTHDVKRGLSYLKKATKFEISLERRKGLVLEDGSLYYIE